MFKGIGVRYLGVIQKALIAEEDPNLEHVINTVNAEMISRAIKWIFRNYLQKADQSVTGQAVAHLLNCLFASCPVQLPQINDDINGNPDKVKIINSQLNLSELSRLKCISARSYSSQRAESPPVELKLSAASSKSAQLAEISSAGSKSAQLAQIALS